MDMLVYGACWDKGKGKKIKSPDRFNQTLITCRTADLDQNCKLFFLSKNNIKTKLPKKQQKTIKTTNNGYKCK
jgi:hypothetical protein